MKSDKVDLKSIDNVEALVNQNGSLGLLALGYQGLVIMRKARKDSGYSFNRHLFIPNKKSKKVAEK